MKEVMWKAVEDGLRILKVAVVVAIPALLLLSHVWTRYQITELGYEVAAQTRLHRQLIEEQRKLSIEAALQGRSERVVARAREQFGLVEVRPEQIVEVSAADLARAPRDADLAQHAALEIH